MTTALENEITTAGESLNAIELEGGLLLELLEGVSSHADKDKGRPTLNAVNLLAPAVLPMLAHRSTRYALS